MKRMLLGLPILLITVSAFAGGPEALLPSELPLPEGSGNRDVIYCQDPAGLAANASVGFGSEIADDIPSNLAGQSFNTVILYVAEWLAPWVDPQGLVLNIYNGQCPPLLDASQSYDYSWEELAPVFFLEWPNVMVVYEVTISLPGPVVITESMSLGAYVLHDWGIDPPFCGLFSTALDEIFGCGEMYWENQLDGIPRWTPFSVAEGYLVDLAYCLLLVPTAMAESEVPDQGPRLLQNHPNPFNPLTRIRIDLPAETAVQLSIFGADGRRVTDITDGVFGSGVHEFLWEGQDGRGRPVPSGVYFYQLEAGSFRETRSMTLAR